MSESFEPVNYATALDLAKVEGKSLWLFRIPRHIPSSRLEGAKVKLRSRKDREGKVVGRINDDTSDAAEDGLILKSADAAESTNLRALWADGEGQLVASSTFAGQAGEGVSLRETPRIRVPEVQNVMIHKCPLLEGPHVCLTVNVSLAPLHPPSDELRKPQEGVIARIVEPYQGRPQLQGMRVRSKLAGAGTEYVRDRAKEEVAMSPSSGDRSGCDGEVDSADATEGRQGSETKKKRDKGRKGRKDHAREEGTDDAHVDDASAAPGGNSSPGVAKGAKRKLSEVETLSGTEASSRVKQKQPSTAVKVKKSKKQRRPSL